MIKIATPISHFFKSSEYSKQLIEISDCLECRDSTIENDSPNQELFHCELQPIHELKHEDFIYLESIKTSKKDLKLITFHLATSCSKPSIDTSKLKSGVFQPGGYTYEKNEMLSNAKKNFSVIKKIFGDKIKVAVENNNYYPTKAYSHIADPEFINDVVTQNDLYFLFDIAHSKISAFNKKVSWQEYKAKLPLERIIQLHICSHDTDPVSNLAFDAHNYPDKFEIQEVKNLMHNYSQIEYLTVEYYREINGLVKSIKSIKKLL